MRLPSWPRPLASTLLAALTLVVAACSVESPALDCVRNEQCRTGLVCEEGRCVAGVRPDVGGDTASDTTAETGGDAAPDVVEDPADEPVVDTAGDPDATEQRDEGGDQVADIPVEDAPDVPGDPRPDLPSLDPAPEINEPGQHGCEGSPEVELTMADTYQHVLAIDPADAFAVSGTITGTTSSGGWYVRRPRGGQSAGTLVVNADGTFRAVVPVECSQTDSNVVKLIWNGDACDLVLVFDVQVAQCRTEDVHVGLLWNVPQGDALDLHLIRESGRINTGDDDCNSNNCIGTSPDWGDIGTSGNPRKNFDAGNGGGPEDIVVGNGAEGTYTIAVERWGTDASGPSDAIVIASIEGRPFVTLTTLLEPRHVWLAAELDFDDERWQPLNEIVDCSENWDEELGCMMNLP